MEKKIENDSWFIINSKKPHYGEVKKGETISSLSEVIIYDNKSEWESALKSRGLSIKESK